MADPATTAPSDDDDDQTSGATDQDTDDDDQQPEVIATILCYPDGSYGLTQGDENEDEAGSEDEAGAEPQRFGSIGELLKGVMETVKDYEAQKGGEGSEAANFKAGFAGGGATTSKMGGYGA